MKKGVALTILLLISLSIFSNELKFYIDVDKEIQNNNFNYEHSKIGELYIQKILDLGTGKKIEKIEYKVLSFQKKRYKVKGENPEISLDKTERFVLKEVNDYVEITSIASVSNHKFLLIKVYPYIESKNKDFSVKVVEIIVKYNDSSQNGKSSYFDRFLFGEKSKGIDLLNKSTNTDLLIITKNSYVEYFKDFINISRAMGFSTEIVSIEDIYDNMSGSDEQEKIRNFVKKIYLEKGLRFLILGGDIEIVPTRFVLSNMTYYSGLYPSDIYYGDMDGDWNSDNDDIIGEISDIEDGFLDIAVTRLPFSNEKELNNILQKFKNYIFKMGRFHLKKFLHAGASLFTNLSDGSGQLMTNNLLNQYEFSNYLNFTLFSPLVDTFHTFPYYQGNMQLNRSTFSQKISEGYYFINHIDHSTEYFLGTGLMETKTEYSNWDTIEFESNDSIYSILFSLGCSSNSFDKLSISKAFLNSKDSPIISYTGFVRTGWTSAENYMKKFWKRTLSDSTIFLGEVILFSNLDDNIYFRTAINTLGFPNLPIFSNFIDTFTIVEKSIDDSIRYNIVDSKGKRSNFLVTLFSKDRIIFRGLTDLNGKVSFPKPIGDTVLYVGIFSKDHRLKIDTISVEKTDLNIETSLVSDTNLVAFKIKNLSNSKLVLKDLKLFKDSPYIYINDTFTDLEINGNDSIVKFVEYRRDLISDFLTTESISVSALINDKKYIDSSFINFENDSFKIKYFAHEKNYLNLSFLNVSSNYIDSLKIVIKNSDKNMTIIDSTFFFGDVKNDSIVQLNDIKFKYNGNPSYIDTSFMKIYFTMKNDTDSIIFRFSKNDTPLTLQLSQTAKGIKISHNHPEYLCDVYKIDNDKNIFIKRMKIDETFFVDTNIVLGENRYFGIFYDNIERTLDTTEIHSVYIKTKVERSKKLVAGSYFGKLNGKSLFSKSSFNYADFNNDGKNEILLLSDDGRVMIVNQDLQEITPFTLITNPYQETTPAIGDVDGNGFYDIVIANGYFNSDTSGFLILNPFSRDAKILPIKGFGVFTSSPVLEDINDDGKSEIIIGTSSGLHVFDFNLNLLFSKSIVNVCGISVSTKIGKIFVNDYYGKIYSYDFSGNLLSGFPKNLNHLTFSPLIVSDLDNDGFEDIVITTIDNYIFVVKENGDLKEGFPFYTSSPNYSSPRIADIDGDGKKEIISLDKNGYIYMLNYKGERVSSTYIGSGENYYNEPLIYDFDGNSQPDIILFTKNGYLISFSSDLKSCDTLLSLNSNFTSAPLVISFDNSDDYKLVSKDLSGEVFIIDNICLGYKKVLFGKTFYDRQNRSYVSGEVLRLNTSDNIDDYKQIKKLKVEYRLKERKFFIMNNIYENVSIDFYNITGSLVFSKRIERNDNYSSFDFNFPNGKYIYIIKFNEKVLSKDKILVLKK